VDTRSDRSSIGVGSNPRGVDKDVERGVNEVIDGRASSFTEIWLLLLFGRGAANGFEAATDETLRMHEPLKQRPHEALENVVCVCALADIVNILSFDAFDNALKTEF
jgi:hypothetical protein